MDSTPKSSKSEKGLRSVFALFIMLAIAVLILIPLTKSMKDSGHVISYEQCIKSPDSKTQETYPEVCVTHDGKRFVNPAQQYDCGRLGWSSNPNSCR